MKILRFLVIIGFTVACNLGRFQPDNPDPQSAPATESVDAVDNPEEPTTIPPPTLTPLYYNTATPPPILQGDAAGNTEFTFSLSTGKTYTIQDGGYRWTLDGRLFGGIAAGGQSPVAYSVELAANDTTTLIFAFPKLPESGTVDVIAYDPEATTGAYARLHVPTRNNGAPATYLDEPSGTITLYDNGKGFNALFELDLVLLAPARDIDGVALPRTMTISGVFQNMPYAVEDD